MAPETAWVKQAITLSLLASMGQVMSVSASTQGIDVDGVLG